MTHPTTVHEPARRPLVSSPQPCLSDERPAAATSWIVPSAVVFVLYLAALMTMVLLKYGLQTGLGSVNVKPFWWLTHVNASTFGNVFGNVAFFVPFGLFLPLLFREMTTARTIVAGFFLSLLFEVTQYVTDTGAADVDDLILNTVGVAIGALVFLLLERFAQSGRQLRRNGLIVVVAFGVVASIVFLVA